MSNRLTQIALDFGPEHAAPTPAPAVAVAESIAQPPLTQYIEAAGVVVRIKALKNPPLEAIAAPAVVPPPAVETQSLANTPTETSIPPAISTDPEIPKEELPALPRFTHGEHFPMPPVAEPTPIRVSDTEQVAEPDVIAEPTVPEISGEPEAALAPAEEPASALIPAEEPALAAKEPTSTIEEPVPPREGPAPATEEPAPPTKEPTSATEEPAPAAEEPAPATEPEPVPEFRTKYRRATTTNTTPAKSAKSAKPAVSKRGRKSLKQVSAEADLIEIPADDILFSKQYYTMGEVSEMFRVNQSLLRFWETEFDILQPRKNKKGDRYFRPVDIKNLHLIYHLLRQKKFTIEGAREFLKKNKKAEERFEIVQRLQEIRSFLLEWKAQL